MGSHLISVEIHNMQSWSEQSGVMEFNPDVLNVIKGRNETGKSVLFKIIYEMVFPGYHGAQYLVRRGAEYGSALFNYADGVSVLFVLYPNGNRLYGIYKDEQLTPYETSRIPDEIIQIMGLVVSWDTRIILNVLDKDIPIPFIKTDPAYNASLLQSKLEPTEISNMFVRAKDYLTRIQSAKAVFGRKEAYWQAKCDALDTADPTEIQYKLASLNVYTLMYYPLVGLWDDLCDLDDVWKLEPSIPQYDLASAKQLLDLLAELKTVQQATSEVQHIISVKPQEPRYTLQQLEDIRMLLDVDYALTQVVDKTSELSVLQEPEVPELPNLDAAFGTLNSLYQICHLCEDVKSLKAPEIPQDPSRSEPFFNLLKTTHQVHQDFNQAVLMYIEQIKASQALQKLNDQITQLEHQLKICPLCGRRYEDE